MRTNSEQSSMDDRDCLAGYPFVVVRIACRVLLAAGVVSLGAAGGEVWPGEKYGPEIGLRDLT